MSAVVSAPPVSVAGFQQVTDFSKPHYLTTKDRLVMPYGPTRVETEFRVLFIHKKEAVLAIVHKDQATKLLKVTFPPIIDQHLVDTTQVQVWHPTGLEYIKRDAAITDVPADLEPATKRVKPAAGESKIAKCKAFYADNKDKLTRVEMTAAFVDQFACTKQGAVTYYLTCAKELGAQKVAA